MTQYYPKSQITPNLYTNGGEYMTLFDKKGFIGYYYKTSKGELYTGRNPNEGFNRVLVSIDISPTENKLIPPSNPSTINFIRDQEISNTSELSEGESKTPYMDFDTVKYQVFFKNDLSKERLIPSYYCPKPTKKDFLIGEFQRYCAKKTNDTLYIEISKEEYKKFQNNDPLYASDLYEVISLPWKLVGEFNDIKTTNTNISKLIEKNNNWYGFPDYISYKMNFENTFG